MAHARDTSGALNNPIPKGLMGFGTGEARRTPNFSTKDVASLWMFTMMKDHPEGQESRGWSGMQLATTVRKRTQVPLKEDGSDPYEGYKISEAVTYSILADWEAHGYVTFEEGTKRYRMEKFYRLTPEGLAWGEQFKEETRRLVLGAALILNQLYWDVYDRNLMTQPLTIEQRALAADLEDEPVRMPKGAAKTPPPGFEEIE